MEQIILEAILNSMENREVIKDRHLGLTKAESYLTKLVAFYNGVTISMDKGRAMHVIYLDFCKVSDLVSQNIL